MIPFKKIALAATTVFFLLLTSGVVNAQENPMNKNQPQTQPKDTWDSWKQDIKTRFQDIRNQADKIKAEADAKKISDQGFKDALDKFEENTKAFSDLWSTAEQVTPERRDSFKSDISSAWDKVSSSFDNVKAEWARVNK
jgi:archaellum component FlaC